MIHRIPPRSVVLATSVALVLGVVGYVAYSMTRPLPVLRVQPVDAVIPAAPAAATKALPRTTPTSTAVDPAWVRRTARAAGIPEAAMRAYGSATLRLASDEPGCHLSWTTLAGIGWVESEQGTIGGRVVEADGRPDRPITGVALDGSGAVARVPDGHGGFERALGPLQFIPSTWATWASDGDGDGVEDPQDLDDAAYAAARYLCASGGDLATAAGWTAAVLSYNHSDDYVRAVYAAAGAYASRTS